MIHRLIRKLRMLKFFIVNILKVYITQTPSQLLFHAELERLRIAHRNHAKNLLPFGYKMYSQADEDGIIHEIFHRIGSTNKIFIEIGVGDGLENNTLALLFDGWQGLWVESSKCDVEKIRRGFSRIIKAGTLRVCHAFVKKDNIDAVLSSCVSCEEIDLLSIDIDGNDVHIFHAITCIRPRVVILEYNAKFPPPVVFCMEYDETHVWQGDDCFGASLTFLEYSLKEKGYVLVGCNLTGSNAFFVREDLVGDKFEEPFSAEKHYEPSRYFLIGAFSGHRASYRTLQKSVHVIRKEECCCPSCSLTKQCTR
jgi:hypothetical protein